MTATIKQIFYDLRHQPVVAWVTLIATALSIFLIMVVVMVQQVQIVPFAPESCRERLMVGLFFHERGINGRQLDNSGGLSYSMAEKIYSKLDGVERASYSSFWTEPAEIKTDLSGAFDAKARTVDATFFEIFDHPLLAGRYFTTDEVNANLPVAVISEKIARRDLGSENWVGSTITINLEPYRVVGVVKDNTPLAQIGSGEVFVPMQPNNEKFTYADHRGNYSVSLLVKDGVDFSHITDQVKARYEEVRSELAADDLEPVYHEQPYDIFTIASGINGSNGSPNPDSSRKLWFIIYALLLIVPAINLGSMLHSRMHRRIREFGVRRAYGCTRMRLIRDIVVENFMLTLIGGVVGLILGIICGSTYGGLFEFSEIAGEGATPPLSAIFNWQIICISVGVCFILNIVSASIPAWIASRLNVVNAINIK